MNLNYNIKSIFFLISISLVKSQYFYQDNYYQDNLDSNDTLFNEPLEPIDLGIEPFNYLGNNDFNDQPQASVSEPVIPTHTQNQQASDKLATEAQINLMPETTSQHKNEKVVQEFFDQLSTPINDKKANESKSNIEVEYIDYDYEEFMNEYYDSTPEDDISSKETILEKVIDKQAEVVDEPPREKKSFNLLYIFVPVATIAALVLVIALAVIFRRIAIKKQSSTSNKNVIYRQVATSETQKV